MGGYCLPFLLRLRELESFALAAGEITRLRQPCVLVHDSVHPHMNAFRVTASAALNPRVVHR